MSNEKKALLAPFADERVAAVCGSVSEAVARAKSINSERTVLVTAKGLDSEGALCLAAATAAAIAKNSDPALPLGGETLRGIELPMGRYSDAEIDALVRAELMGKKDLEAPMIEDEEDDEFDDLPLLGADE